VRPPPYRPAAILAIPVLAALPSCATGDHETGRVAPPIPKTIGLTLEAPEPGIYGTKDEWLDEVIGALLETGACADAWAEGDPPGPGKDPDAKLIVRLSSGGKPGPAERDAQGALLDFLAWSIIPPVPLWIPDVRVDPDLDVEVSAVDPDGWKIPLGEGDARCPPVLTSHLDRNAFLSWKTLGSIVVPPFVFKEPDREHLQQEIAGDVRRFVAAGIARKVKEAAWGSDRFEELGVARKDGATVLRYKANPGVIGMLSIGIEQYRPRKSGKAVIRIPIDRKSFGLQETVLDLGGFTGDLRYLRVEALPRSKGGSSSWYTIPLPPAGAAEEVKP